MIGDLERATFSNIEEQNIGHWQSAIRPWLVQIEQALRRDLFQISAGKRKLFAEHLIEGLLRGDSQARAAYLQTMRTNGVLNGDEWRAMDNLNPIPGGKGKIYLAAGEHAGVGARAGAAAAPTARGWLRTKTKTRPTLRMRPRRWTMKQTRPNDGIERREMALEGLELRVDEASGAPIVSGYAAVFNSLSEVLFEWEQGRFREQIAPGAFTQDVARAECTVAGRARRSAAGDYPRRHADAGGRRPRAAL